MAFVNPPGWQPNVSTIKFSEPLPFAVPAPAAGVAPPTNWWYSAWPDPPPLPYQTIYESFFWNPQLQQVATAQPNVDWMVQWPDPKPLPSQAFSESISWVPFVPAQVNMGWFEPFSIPVTLQPRSDSGTISWVPLGSPKINLGWYVQWQNPVYQSVSAYPPASQWTPFIPSAGTLTPSQMGWYQQWSQPILVFSTIKGDIFIPLGPLTAARFAKFVSWIQEDDS